MSKRIGSYQIARPLDDDGCSFVASSSDGSVRVLRVYDAPTDPDAWEAVQTHVRICSAIDHPAVCRVVEAFRNDDGTIVVVTEAPADGITLDELLEEGSGIHPGVAWYVGYQIAAALASVQAAGADDDDFVTIVHGYLSPKSVHLGWQGDVSVDGFGVAPLAESMAADGSGYAPPEARATPRGDVYSLAATIWAALGGRSPGTELTFDALDTFIPDGLAELLARASESSLAKRKVTSIELEHALKEASSAQGRKQLANALVLIRKSRPPPSARPRARSSSAPGPAPSQRPSAPGSERGRALTGRRHHAHTPLGGVRAASSEAPPSTSKKATLLGGLSAPTARRQMSSSPIDWDAAEEDASTIIERSAFEIEDELTWGQASGGPLSPPPLSPPRSPPPLPAQPASSEPPVQSLSALSPPSQLEPLTDGEKPQADKPLGDLAGVEMPVVSTPDSGAAGEQSGDVELSMLRPLESVEPLGDLISDVLGVTPPSAEPLDDTFDGAEDDTVAELTAKPSETDAPSPWEPTSSTVPPAMVAPEPEPISMLAAVAIALGTAIAVMVVGVWVVRSNATVATPPAPTATSSAQAGASSAKPGSVLASTSASAVSSVAPATKRSAAPAAKKDGSALAPTFGYLTVRFRGNPDAEVFVFGKSYGKVGQPLEVPCKRTAFVTVGTPAKIWLTDGVSVQVRCQGSTEVEIKPR